MAWNTGELILGEATFIGTRISNSFTPQDPGGGNELRVRPDFTDDNVVANPEVEIVLRVEKQVNGEWVQYAVTSFQGGAGKTEADLPSVYFGAPEYGVLYRCSLESIGQAKKVALRLQTGIDE